MASVLALFVFFAMMLAFCTGFFLFAVQPVWTIVDVAVSPRRSSGAKVAIILLTLLALGPLLTFFYALFGTHSRGLRTSTIVGASAFAVSLVLAHEGITRVPPD